METITINNELNQLLAMIQHLEKKLDDKEEKAAIPPRKQVDTAITHPTLARETILSSEPDGESEALKDNNDLDKSIPIRDVSPRTINEPHNSELADKVVTISSPLPLDAMKDRFEVDPFIKGFRKQG